MAVSLLLSSGRSFIRPPLPTIRGGQGLSVLATTVEEPQALFGDVAGQAVAGDALEVTAERRVIPSPKENRLQ